METLHIDEITPPVRLFSQVEQLLYSLITLTVPPICFLFSFFITFGAKDVKLNKDFTFSASLLQIEASIYFFPLLIFSMVALYRAMTSEVYSRSVITRLGVYTGFFLAVQYCILVFRVGARASYRLHHAIMPHSAFSHHALFGINRYGTSLMGVVKPVRILTYCVYGPGISHMGSGLSNSLVLCIYQSS
jgi:hypothetical protein